MSTVIQGLLLLLPGAATTHESVAVLPSSVPGAEGAGLPGAAPDAVAGLPSAASAVRGYTATWHRLTGVVAVTNT